MKRGWLLIASLPLLLAADDDIPELRLPIACELGRTCAVQNYVNHAQPPDVRDWHCGHRSYGKHDGTDIRILSMEQQRRGVAVLAAAAGTVWRVRDGVTDISVREIGQAAVDRIGCGNAVVINHAGGLRTGYCHMAKGSILVKPGDHVDAGTPIGKVGLSGETEYPHLHFAVLKDGRGEDPFAFGAAPGACNGGRNIWAASSGLRNSYQSGQVLNAGFATGPVTMADAIEHGADQQPRPSRAAPVLGAFVQAIDLAAGDVQHLSLAAPNGELLVDNNAPPLDHDKAQWILFAGRKRPAAGWPAGRYTAHYQVIRNGKAVIDKQFAVLLN
jgi:hypothetical protein